MELFFDVSQRCSQITTEAYSTSFASAIKLLHRDIRKPIYNIYGFVRFADEIVDSFHAFEKQTLLAEFKAETFKAIHQKISLNPILHSFQATVNEFHIDHGLIHDFFKSMEMDLNAQQYDGSLYNEYIYGSAEVVGLMCLYVFCEGDKDKWEQLKPYARSLGAAFQKVNFLRDARFDYEQLKRTYFPGVDFSNFTVSMKQQIEMDIAADFHHAYQGVKLLPLKARFGVYVAYKYYASLFKKIKKTHSSYIWDTRIRISDYRKALIVLRAILKNQLNLI
ncbi:MAG: phytoene/squalene synthase family protein [Bacteroidetes bacterium]|nr:phytoene/squalene synthase family protein [Bacteroidota bacterium]